MADLDLKGGEFLEDMLHESGMAGWVQQLGLKGHDQFAACALYEEPDPVLNLHYNVGNADAEQASAKAAESRIRQRSPDEGGPDRRRARHLSFGTGSQTEDDLEAAAGQGGGEEGADSAKASPSSSYSTRSRNAAAAADSQIDRKDTVGGRGERVRVKREEGKDGGTHKALAALTAAANRATEPEELSGAGGGHFSPAQAAQVPSTPSQTPGPRRDKGLRSFSLKVCQKVEERDVTTYNQVADELVSEFKLDDTIPFDEKNIRRRIYDALNVLMAMDIITKDKKHIKWKGFPQSWEKERQGLERRVEDASRQVGRKRKEVEKKALQYIALCNIIKRNAALLQDEKPKPKDAAAGEGALEAGAEGAAGDRERRRIRIPFVIVKTSPSNEINLELAADQQEALLNCNSSFELHDDVAILEHLDMAQVASEDELHALLRSCPEVPRLLLDRLPSVVRSRR